MTKEEFEMFPVSDKSKIRTFIHTKIVGVTFENRQQALKESRAGDELLVRHAPSERFPEATEVINRRTGQALGHIRKELAFDLLKSFGNEFCLNGKITELCGGTPEKPTCGCNIMIFFVSN